MKQLRPLQPSHPLDGLRVKSDPSMYLSIYVCVRTCARACVHSCVRALGRETLRHEDLK
jgi:hypothetical protein